MEKKLNYLSSMLLNPKTWISVFGAHQLRIPQFDWRENKIHNFREFHLSQPYLNEWNQLFDTDADQTIVPYTYYWPWLIEFLMHRLLPRLQLNLRNVLHLRQEAEFFEDYSNDNSLYQNINRLIDLCPMEKNRVMIVTETLVVDQDGRNVFRSIDYTIALDVPTQSLQQLAQAEEWNQTSLDFMKGGFRRKKALFPNTQDAPKRLEFYCQEDFWLRFGLVSGAVSITHGYWLISRYFRKHEPFLQGMCTGNMVIMLLVKELGEKLSHFEVSFSDKLYFPQQVELRFDDHNFELFDEKNRMVAFGRRTMRT